MRKQDKKRVFSLEEVGYTNLDGQFVTITFDKKDFANALFANAQSIEMDDFARSVHKEGKAELTEQVEHELLQILPTLYKHRVVQAVRETLEKIK